MAEDELGDGEEDGAAEGLGEDEDGHADGDCGGLEAVLDGDDGLGLLGGLWMGGKLWRG